MSLHLAEIANTVKPGGHAVLLLDQAGWHLSTRLVVPPNITIIALPPKSPELNPMENIWQFVHDNWLSNRIFASYEDLLEHCCEAWNSSSSSPGGSYPWVSANGRMGADQRDSVSGLNFGFGVLSPSMSGNVLMPWR
jgi:DDE superfamily endonuclease